MENIEFKKLLFKVACCTIVCDGEMHKDEIDELRIIEKTTSYFIDVDLSIEFFSFIEDVKANGVKIINDLFLILKSNKFNPIQELLFLEVALRIINADNAHDESEIRFIRHLRSHLELHDEIIKDRFGSLPLLSVEGCNDVIKIDSFEDIIFTEITIPDICDFESL